MGTTATLDVLMATQGLFVFLPSMLELGHWIKRIQKPTKMWLANACPPWDNIAHCTAELLALFWWPISQPQGFEDVCFLCARHLASVSHSGDVWMRYLWGRPNAQGGNQLRELSQIWNNLYNNL
jgi:hypothetical protein